MIHSIDCWCSDCDAADAAFAAESARQAADFHGFEPTYYAALRVIADEPGAGRWARAIDLVAKIWGKSVAEVTADACVVG